MPLSQTDIKANAKMGLQLGIDPLNTGERRNRGDLPALEIQDIPSEDISEEVAFQELIDDWSERIDRPGDRPPYQACLNLRTEFDAALAGRQGIASLPTRSLTPFFARSSMTLIKVPIPFRLRGKSRNRRTSAQGLP